MLWILILLCLHLTLESSLHTLSMCSPFGDAHQVGPRTHDVARGDIRHYSQMSRSKEQHILQQTAQCNGP